MSSAPGDPFRISNYRVHLKILASQDSSSPQQSAIKDSVRHYCRRQYLLQAPLRLRSRVQVHGQIHQVRVMAKVPTVHVCDYLGRHGNLEKYIIITSAVTVKFTTTCHFGGEIDIHRPMTDEGLFS